MLAIIGIFTPCMLASLILNVTSNLMFDNPDKYLKIILALNITGRIPIMFCEVFMFYTFITVFRYFVNKKRELMS
jgi:hypothetical protein